MIKLEQIQLDSIISAINSRAKTTALATKQDTLTAGTGININNGIITNTVAEVMSGNIIGSTSYCSGYGSGARTISSSNTWSTILIGGTGKDNNNPLTNVNIRSFNKKQVNSHIRIRGSFPIYITPGGAGCGIRVRTCLSNVPTIYNDDVNYFTLGLLTNGQADNWGGAGYGGNTAAIMNFYYDSQYSVNSANVFSYVGNLQFYFQGAVFTPTDTTYFIDYQPSYPKYASWTCEEYYL